MEHSAAILRRLDKLHDRIEEIAPRVASEAFSLEQIASQLNVSKDTVTRWTQRGDLPSFKLGSLIRVRRTDLDKFIKQRLRFA